MRRLLSLLAAILMLLILMPASVAYAAPPTISAQSAVVIDAKTGQVIFAKNENDRIFPASTTKIMSAILAIESGKLDEEYVCGDETNVSTGESQMPIKHLAKGEKIKVKDLLYGMLLQSANDGANACAVAVAGTKDAFVEMMNKKAHDLHMDNTNFMNPPGIQDDNHYSTAADMAIIARYAMQNETFREIVNTKEYTIPATNKCGARKLTNTNKLISSDPNDSKYVYQGAIGIKTGLTPKAQGCLVAEAVKDSMSLIVCIYNDGDWPNGLKRWTIAKNLFDYGFNDFASVDITGKLNQAKYQPLTVEGTEVDTTPKFDNEGPQFFTGLKDDVSKIDTAEIVASTSWTKTTLPIKKDDVLGTVQYKMGDTVVATAKLVASGDADTETIATDQPAASQPASPGDPGYVHAKHIKDTSVVAIVIVVAVLAAGVIMLIVLLSRRHRKNAIYNRNARKRRGRNDYYNYRRRF